MPTLLGVVIRTRPDTKGKRVAWVRPLMDTTEVVWREVDQEEFPPKGLFWPGVGSSGIGTLLFFQPKENTKHDPTITDEFMVGDSHFALEVLDLRQYGNEDQLRLALTTTGIKLLGNHQSRSLMWCADNLLIGPVGLVGGPHGTTIEKASRHQIRFCRLRPSEIRTVSYEGADRLVCAKMSLPAPEGYFDWDDDRQVVRRAIDQAVDLAQRSGAVVDRAKQLIEETAGALTKEGPLADLELSLNRLQRTRALIKSIEHESALANEVATALLKHPTVLKELEQVKSVERSRAKAEADAAIKNEREELAKVQRERSAVDAALKTAKKAVEDAEAEANRKASEIEGRIRSRIEETVRNAPELLSEIAILRPFLGGVTSTPRPVSESLPIYPRWKVGSVVLSTVRELRARIVSLVKAAGVQASTCHRIHAAFSAHLMPVLAGPKALEALRAYAQVASAGRMAVIQVTSGLVEPGDIFGRVQPARSRFVPHAAGLIDIVLAARESEGAMLVVLDGANRGATESYLLPLLRGALRNSGELALFHPLAVEAQDPYRACGRIKWPQNLLLAATLVEGPTTLPVAPDVWADSVLIQTDVGEVPALVQSASPMADFSEIDLKSALLSSPAGAGDHSAIDTLDGVVKSQDLRDVAGRFERALSAFQTDPGILQVELVRGVIVPWVASIANDDDRAGAIAGISKAIGAKASAGLQEAIEGARRRTA